MHPGEVLNKNSKWRIQKTLNTVTPHEFWQLFVIIFTYNTFVYGDDFLWWNYTVGIIPLPDVGQYMSKCQFNHINKFLPDIYKYGDLEETNY